MCNDKNMIIFIFFQERFSLHLYSINGKHLFTEKLMYGLCHMIIKGDHVITGDIQGHLTIKEIFG